MTQDDWAREKASDNENKRLRAQVDALKYRLKVAKAETRAAKHARDIALKFARDPGRYPS